MADALCLAGELHWYWHVRGHFAEGHAWIERTLAAAPASDESIPATWLAQAHFAAGQLAIDQGDPAAAQRHCERSLARWRGLENDPEHRRAVQGPLILAIGRVLQARAIQGDHSGMPLLVEEINARIAALADPVVRRIPGL